MSPIARGDIRWLKAPREKRRPALVVGRADLIPSWSQVPVIPLSSQIRGLPWEVRLDVSDGVPLPCVLKVEWIRSVERAVLGPLLTTLPTERWAEVRTMVLDVLGL